MPTLVRLLGRPAVQHEDTWLEPPAGLPSALLYYLAYKNAWVSREQLAFLFWSDMPEANARKNLRNLVLRAKELPFAENLEIERSRIRWQVKTDLDDFGQAVSEGQLEKAAELYTGELLEGFRLDNALAFDEWLELEREELRKTFKKAALQYADDLESQENFAKAAEALESFRKTDPFDETVLRRQLQNLQAANESARAIAIFERFKTQLKAEYDVEPEVATLQLLNAVRQDVEIKPTAPKNTIPVAQHNLPIQLTPFVGREIEKKRIVEQLVDPDCRLLSLVAPGGFGKTRLALTVAQEQLGNFQNGVWFVPFASVTQLDQVVYAVVDALELTLSGGQEPKAQLLAYLKDKEMLLVLDNLEHLLAGITFINELLETAPKLKVLATSRERLNLKAEWLIDLRGLSYPHEETAENLERFDAVTLFEQSAKRLQPGFALNDASLPLVLRICQLVAGMPLAIELTVSWLPALSLEEIVKELRQGLDLLEASTRDVPQRHQSVRVVFDSSWQFLNSNEQEVLSKLAVFRSGFLREAAREVTGASLPVLANLVRKSFLTRLQDGRYERHPLIYQYCYEKFKQRQDYSEVRERHKCFYSKTLQDWHEAINSGKQAEIFQLIGTELDNIRQAVYWATSEKKFSEMQVAVKPLETYFVQAGRFHEGLELFGLALTSLDTSNDADQAAKAKALVSQAHFYYRLGQFDKTIEAAEQGVKLLESTGDKDNLPGAYNVLGAAALGTSNYPEAKRHFEKALMLAKSEGFAPKTANYANNLGAVLADLGFYDRAALLYNEALNVHEQNDHFISQVRVLNNLGELRLMQENYPDAKAFFERGLNLSKEGNFQQPLAHLLNGLAKCALELADYAGAERLAYEAEQSSRTSGEESIRIEALETLGRVMLVTGRLEQTQTYLLEALKAAWKIKGLRQIFPILLTLASLKARKGEGGKAQTLVKTVLDHTASSQAHKDRAEQLLSEINAGYGPDSMLDVVENGTSLEALVETILSLHSLENP